MLGDRNFGRYKPNLFSIPANVAVASLYPPMCSGLTGGRSEIRVFGVGSDPEGLLFEDRRKKAFLLFTGKPKFYKIQSKYLKLLPKHAGLLKMTLIHFYSQLRVVSEHYLMGN